MNPKLKKWLDWIEKIQENAHDLLMDQHLFQEYSEIIRKNPAIQRPSDFHDWVRKNYASSVALHIRRQLDMDSDSISIKRLLTEIQNDPQILTKEWHRSLYKTLGPSYADKDFEDIAGQGEFFDPNIAKEDIEKLDTLGEHIEKYATRRLAHNSNRPIQTDPTYNDLTNFINEFEQIMKKYILLLTASGYESLLPVWQYDWAEIFTKPWIKNTAN